MRRPAHCSTSIGSGGYSSRSMAHGRLAPSARQSSRLSLTPRCRTDDPTELEAAMRDQPPDPDGEDQPALDRAADDGWPPDIDAASRDTNRAEHVRRAIGLLRAWHAADPDRASAIETIVRYLESAPSREAQVRELVGMLQGMTLLADFLVAHLERATGG